MATAQDSKNTNIDQLNSFLRGELSAVESYRIAMEKIGVTSPARGRLAACLDSHFNRVDALRTKIRELGGRPSPDAGAWGAMTSAIEASAVAFGERAAITALETGEDHGLADYRADIRKLDGETRDLVNTELLPRQEETHRLISDLKRELAQHAM
jgi:demethoxyubiquinone hydroxylase (CLK1/Coq7/Cat5 family)